MPPKIKITKKDIIQTALMLVEQNGESSLNARSIAAALDCSTQPVFSNFASMEELQCEVVNAAYEKYMDSLKRESECGKYPEYKSFGMAYIRFAKEKTQLFKLLFMCDRKKKELTPTDDFDASVRIIMNANNISKEKAELMHLEMWTCVHGIATMLATSFLELDWDTISNILTDVYQGIRNRHLSEENKQ